MEPLGRVTAATLDVLRALVRSEAPVWGLRLVKITGRPSGSVYPILDRLERSGWVRSAWEDDPTRSGPRRRLYELTSDGASAAAEALGKDLAASTGARARRAPKPQLGTA